MVGRVTIVAAIGLSIAIPVHAQTPQEGLDGAIAELDWRVGSGSHTIAASNVVIQTQDNEAFVQGRDAHAFMRLMEGHDRFTPSAVVLKLDGPLSDSLVAYEYLDMGYVKMDDWDEYIDPEEILSIIQASTNDANEARADGYPSIYVDGWIEEPYLDEQNAIVYWAIKGHDETGAKFVNAKALKLGRNGISDLLWIGAPEQFYGASANLQPALRAHRFQDGFRYADFDPSVDTVAAVGIGAVAYKMLTGSSKKGAAAVGAGILAVIAAFAKKLWILLFLPFIFVWRAITRLVGNKHS